MKCLLIILASILPLFGFAGMNGEQIFTANCAACYTVGNGRLVGPDLQNVLQRRDEEWVRRFILSSQTMIAEGDSLAMELFVEFGYVPMPDQPLNESDVLALMDYLALVPQDSSSTAATQPGPSPIGTGTQKSNTDTFLNPVAGMVVAFFIVIILTLLTMFMVNKMLLGFLMKSENEKKELLKKLKMESLTKE